MSGADQPQVPADVDAERAALGAILIDGGASAEVVGKLRPGDFYSPRHRTIYEAIATLQLRQEPVDFLTVSSEISRRGTFNGGDPDLYLSDLIGSVPSAINVASYVATVREMARRRQLIALAERAARDAWALDMPIGESVAHLVSHARDLAEDAHDRPRYELHVAAEALEPQPPVPWVISGLFAEGSVSLLVGDPGTAKTYSTLDAAVCVASGEPWLEFATVQGAVLVIDEESGPRRFARRLGDCMRGHRAGPETLVFYTTLARFDLRSGEDAMALSDAILQTDARLVVIDALVDVMPGGDEDRAQEVHPIFMRLREIAAERDAAIVVIHHNNKAGGYRGSSAMHGAVDNLITIKKRHSALDFECMKLRDAAPFKFGALGCWDADAFWLMPSEAQPDRPVFTKPEMYVLRYLSRHGECDTNAIMSHADTCTDASARRAIYALVDKGYARRTDAGGSGSLATWGLTDKGEEAAKANL